MVFSYNKIFISHFKSDLQKYYKLVLLLYLATSALSSLDYQTLLPVVRFNSIMIGNHYAEKHDQRDIFDVDPLCLWIGIRPDSKNKSPTDLCPLKEAKSFLVLVASKNRIKTRLMSYHLDKSRLRVRLLLLNTVVDIYKVRMLRLNNLLADLSMIFFFVPVYRRYVCTQ